MAIRVLKIDPRIAFTSESDAHSVDESKISSRAYEPWQAIACHPPAKSAPPNRARLQNAPAEHADTVVSAYEPQLLHHPSALNLLGGLLGGRDELSGTITAAMDTPESIPAILNFLRLTKFLASMPANVLDSLAKTVRTGAERDMTYKVPGTLPLLWRLRNEDSRHAASVGPAFLEDLGTGL